MGRQEEEQVVPPPSLRIVAAGATLGKTTPIPSSTSSLRGNRSLGPDLTSSDDNADAFFASTSGIGVADGVGLWQELGLNAKQFSRSLMKGILGYAEEIPVRRRVTTSLQKISGSGDKGGSSGIIGAEDPLRVALRQGMALARSSESYGSATIAFALMTPISPCSMDEQIEGRTGSVSDVSSICSSIPSNASVASLLPPVIVTPRLRLHRSSRSVEFDHGNGDEEGQGGSTDSDCDCRTSRPSTQRRSSLRVGTIGDSRVLILRPMDPLFTTHHGTTRPNTPAGILQQWRIVYESRPQTVHFNCPRQISHFPPFSRWRDLERQGAHLLVSKLRAATLRNFPQYESHIHALSLSETPLSMKLPKRAAPSQHRHLSDRPDAPNNDECPLNAINSIDKLSTFEVEIYEGDLIMAATDGLFDNLHPTEWMSLLPPPIKKSSSSKYSATPLQYPSRSEAHDYARNCVLQAAKRSRNPVAQTPFSLDSLKHGFAHQGGKPDDVTVVFGWVV